MTDMGEVIPFPLRGRYVIDEINFSDDLTLDKTELVAKVLKREWLLDNLQNRIDKLDILALPQSVYPYPAI